ncbi:MAG: ABC transporter ATP-binding protein [Armatimonadetes bacterium]|nr:ABC transporter ATP-binding protein [Armatimonadota bacterium]
MRTIRRLLGFAKPYWMVVGATIICCWITRSIMLILPQFQRRIVDECYEGGHFELLNHIVMLYIVCGIIRAIFGFGWGYLAQYVAQRTIYDIRNKMFDHIQRLSFSYHDEAETGQLISRATADADALQGFLSDGMFFILSESFAMIGLLIICFSMSWQLSLAALSMVPFLVIAVYFFSKKIGPLFAAVQQQLGERTSAIQQSFSGIRVVKAFAREEYETEKFDRESQELLARNIDAAKVQAFYGPMMDFIAAYGFAFVLWKGGVQVLDKDIKLGVMIAFMAYVMSFVWPIRMMGYITQLTKNALVSAERIFEILDMHSETHLKDGARVLKNCSGHVVFNNVSFCYTDGSRALSCISIEAKPGEMIAVMGDTGSGKSSLINLLPRFYDVAEGAVFVDGVDIRKYKLESLRRHIGIVSQEPFLFGDSIYENIAYGRPGAPFEEVVEVAKAANIHDFIDSLPDGYDTLLGERGVNLSGGQKQRVAIARALLMNPPILILDDATSSVDTETESLIQQALASLTESRTTFVIAQRVSTVKRADKIIVLNKGRLVESGFHDELMAKNGHYAELFNLQFSGQEMEDVNA